MLTNNISFYYVAISLKFKPPRLGITEITPDWASQWTPFESTYLDY